MPHGHQAGWAPKEIGLFVNSILDDRKPLAKIGKVSRKDKQVTMNFQSELPIKSAALHYTTGTGAWKERKWETIAVRTEGNSATATLPVLKDATWFFTLTDKRDATVSSEHQTIK